MKKILIALAILTALVSTIGSFVVISVLNSPEYALKQIIADVKESGEKGLKPHLTGEVEEVFDYITGISDNIILKSVISTLGVDEYTDMLKSELSEIDWSMGDVLKNNDKANIYLEFDYKDKLTGTVILTMIREDNSWKICKVEFPSFDKIDW